MLDDVLPKLTEDNDVYSNTEIIQNEKDSNEDTIYIALPSNEEELENVTETELAQALGEITDLDIVRIDPSHIDANQIDKEQDILPINSLESNKEDSKENTMDTQEAKLNNTNDKTNNLNKENIKDLDANSLIDFFKNTPKEKLHEIFDGSEVSFNIKFGKNSD